VSKELNEEKIDVILWDENPAQFVINAMAPVEVVSIIFDEDSDSMDVAVKESDVSQAIGHRGQNVRLASQLTGWELNVMNEFKAEEKREAEAQNLINLFRNQLHVDEEVATALVEEGFTSLDEIAYVPIAELLDIEEFDEPLVEQLRRNAKDALVTKAIAKEEVNGIAPDLLAFEGMDNELAFKMVARGVVTVENLAEQSVDELMEIEGMDKQRAAAMIMKAREPWFSADAQNT
ncbi:transcription elongation factor NusA, partial [Achromatium sp. WMS3]